MPTKTLNILHFTALETSGGAARAAYRIHRSLVEHGASFGVQSRMRVLGKQSDDPTVINGPTPASLHWFHRRMRPRRFLKAKRGFQPSNPILHSIAWPASGLAQELALGGPLAHTELLHLHWLGDHMLSIEEIGAIHQPLVWTLHDQWAFCGAEHYAPLSNSPQKDIESERFAQGYPASTRPESERGPDLNRLTYLRKQRAWKRPMQMVCPSHWMAEAMRRSPLMASWPATVIPYPIDLEHWCPASQQQARALLGLPAEIPLVLFGAVNGTADPRKGADLLLEALKRLRSRVADSRMAGLAFVVFGESRPAQPPDLGFPIHYVGRLADDLSLRLHYAAADVFVIPSRQDNLPNTGLEAHACGVPVVAFRTGGLEDIVEDRITGALAEPFDPESLASAIQWVLEDPIRCRTLGAAARARAERLWDPQRIAGLYADVYRQALLTRPH